LNALLPWLLPRYDVRIEEYLTVTSKDVRLNRVQPDLTISTTDAWRTGAGAAVAVAEPITAELEYP
jgi:opacity protein-like surface antigen